MKTEEIMKIMKTPKDQWEAIDFMIEAQGLLLRAIHIMESQIENDELENHDFHKKTIIQFLNQFKL
jgi:hypothetical protein